MTRRVALITGGTSGIGLATARMLHADGHAVGLLDIDADRLAAAARDFEGGSAPWTRQADVRDAAAVAAAVEQAAEAMGPIGILVNSVGGSTLTTPAAEMAVEEFDAIVTLNLRTVFLCTRFVLPQMMAAGWGRIVNVSSVAGRSNALFTNSNAAYCAAKAAVEGFTRQCAFEVAASGITVNAVAPGPTSTERVLAGWRGRSPEDREAMLGRIPAGRFGEPGEMAAAIRYLCSEDAAYTTGVVIDVNGGMYM